MDKCNIDMDKLTKEAEAGHGHFVRAVLDEMSFRERLLTLQQMQKLSEERHLKNAEAPYLKVKEGTNSIVNLEFAGMELYRYVPHTDLLGLADAADIIYQDWITFPGGKESITDTDIFEK